MFPQLKNTFPGMNSEISRNLSQFPETEEGHVQCWLDARKSSQFAHNLYINTLFNKLIVHSLGAFN